MADAAAVVEGESATSYTSEADDSSGTLASDEALQALRDKLTGEDSTSAE